MFTDCEAESIIKEYLTLTRNDRNSKIRLASSISRNTRWCKPQVDLSLEDSIFFLECSKKYKNTTGSVTNSFPQKATKCTFYRLNTKYLCSVLWESLSYLVVPVCISLQTGVWVTYLGCVCTSLILFLYYPRLPSPDCGGLGSCTWGRMTHDGNAAENGILLLWHHSKINFFLLENKFSDGLGWSWESIDLSS